MRALVLTQHYPPEVTAASFRLAPIVDALAAAGHDVDVVCAVPNHPAGVIEPEFRGRFLVRGKRGSVRTRHVWVHARPEKTMRTRLLNYGSYALGATATGIARRGIDIVLASSPPLTVGAAGLALAIAHRCPFAFDVRDLWPDSAIALGELREGGAARAAERLERLLYRRADLILTPNESFATTIRAKGGVPVEVVPNGTTSEWLTAGEAEPDREGAGFPQDRFVWAYAGNLGLAHALDEAIAAADLLGDEFRLIVIGTGPRRGTLEDLAQGGVASGRVEFRGVMEPGDAARHLRAADAVLVAERQAQTVSAKLYDCAAIGRPIVAACTGELERIITEEEVGLPVPLANPEALAAAVRRLRDEPDVGAGLVARARPFAAAHLRERQAGRVVDLLEDCAARGKARVA